MEIFGFLFFYCVLSFRLKSGSKMRPSFINSSILYPFRFIEAPLCQKNSESLYLTIFKVVSRVKTRDFEYTVLSIPRDTCIQPVEAIHKNIGTRI
jgi:hypothetical protein